MEYEPINQKQPNSICSKLEWWHPEKMEDILKKMEEDLQKNGRQTNQPKST